MDDVSKRVISVLAEILDVNANKINTTSSTLDTRGWDSFATMQFIIGIEKEFDITVKIEDAENFTSVEKVIDILTKTYLK